MKGFITRIDLDESSKPEFCEACAKVKSVRQPYPQELYTRAEKYGNCVHWDLWGPASVKSLNGHFYVAAQIEDATRKTKLYFQEKKSKTLRSYKKDEAYIETQTSNCIKTIHSDRGGEFLSGEFIQHQDSHRTIRKFTVHDSPQTWAERAQALLISSGLPHFLWEEAMKYSTWLQNQMPAQALNGKTPFEMKIGWKTNLANIHEFRVAAYVKDLKARKLDSHVVVGRWWACSSSATDNKLFCDF